MSPAAQARPGRRVRPALLALLLRGVRASPACGSTAITVTLLFPCVPAAIERCAHADLIQVLANRVTAMCEAQQREFQSLQSGSAGITKAVAANASEGGLAAGQVRARGCGRDAIERVAIESPNARFALGRRKR